MKFEFLEHTADLKVRVYGDNLNEVFENAGLAFFESVCDTSKVNPLIKKSLTINSESKESLLYDFLEELLYLHEAEHFLFSKFKVIIRGDALTAVLRGERINKNHELRNLVKAVTYSEMIVTDSMAQFVLDL